jgi:hypothetical protein
VRRKNVGVLSSLRMKPPEADTRGCRHLAVPVGRRTMRSTQSGGSNKPSTFSDFELSSLLHQCFRRMGRLAICYRQHDYRCCTFFVGRDGELAHNANSACIRKAWEKYYKKKWSKNPKAEKIWPGGSQDAHHKKYRSRGGSDHPRNIEPRTPSNRIRYHQKNGYK